MVAFILPANSATGGYEIDNSLRFNYVDSPSLQFTPSSAGTEETFTISAWIKKSMNSGNSGTGGQDCYLFSSQADSNNRTVMGVFGSSGTQGIFFENKVSGTSSYVDSAATFRDPSAWMHCVWAIDTTQGTNTNRVKLYVNGSQITSFDSTSYPNQNVVTQWSRAQVNYVGSRAAGNYYDGYMAEVHVIDGTQKAASDFGEYNDNGVWIPIKYTGSYGTNGYYLQFKETGTSQNSSGIGADTSGNDNHFAVSNLAATDVTTDTPTNNFATMNPLDNYYSAHTMSEGNVKFVTNDSGDGPFQTATIGDLKQGKWYFEFKYTDPAHLSGGDAAGEFYGQIGICGSGFAVATDAAFSSFEHNFAYDSSNGRIKFNNTAGTVHGASISADGQIIGFLIDLDNNRVTTHLNGQYADGSGNHDESSPTAYVSVTAPASTPLGGYMIAFGENVAGTSSGTQNTGTYEINFGNPSFAISSSNADADGHGNFEYAVPSGYFALCTKNLAEYG